jgi:flagellar biosynthesis component FlhA
MHPDILAKQNELSARFAETNIAARVNASEVFAINNGFEEWDGLTVTDFIASLLEEYTWWMIENKELVNKSMTPEEAEKALVNKAETAVKLNKFLEEEDARIKKADELLKLMDKYRLGPLDPRYRKLRKQYSEVVKSFKLVGPNYEFRYPKLD